MTTRKSIVGFYFLMERENYYCTGMIEGEVNDGVYLLSFCQAPGDDAPPPPMELMDALDMTTAAGADQTMFLFPTKTMLDAYLKWLDKPTTLAVLKLVPKTEGETK